MDAPPGSRNSMYHSTGMGNQAPWGCHTVPMAGRISSSPPVCLCLYVFVSVCLFRCQFIYLSDRHAECSPNIEGAFDTAHCRDLAVWLTLVAVD